MLTRIELLTITEEYDVSKIPNLDERLDIRVNSQDKQLFLVKCTDLGRSPQSLLREMVQAVNEGRLKINVTKEQLNNQQEIYNVS
jgi:hypothetical protein